LGVAAVNASQGDASPDLDADDLAMPCEAASYRLDGAGTPGYETVPEGRWISVPATFAH